MKNFPKILYVKIEKERDPEDNFLIAVDNYADIAEPEETVDVAVYDLITVKHAINKTELVN